MTAVSVRRGSVAAVVGRGWADRDAAALWLVGLGYAIVQFVVVGPRFSLGPDELIYASQVYGGPRLQWTAPRARGVPALIWPVVHFTTSVPALRLYLMALSGIGLVLAYRPWLRIRPGPLAPLAALLFASLWIAEFYGNAAMPNLWVALAAVAAAGYFVRSGLRPGRVPLLGIGGALAAASLIRPSDSLYLALPMAALAVLRPARRWTRLGAVAAGVAAGWVVWCIEGYTNWGGALARLRAAQAEDASGLHANLMLYARTLAGPLEWSPGQAHPFGWQVLAAGLWWVALVPLVVIGLLAARRRGPAEAYGLVVAMALSGAFQYLFLLSVVGVRHLLATYALLMLPAAEGVCAVAARRGSAARTAAAAVLAVGFLGHWGIQLGLLRRQADSGRPGRLAVQDLGAQLHAVGIRPPCAIGGGNDRALVAYWARCRQLLVDSSPAGWRRTQLYLGDRGRRFPTAPRDVGRTTARFVILQPHESRPPAVLRGWHRSFVTDRSGRVLDLYTP